jgi:uncharacterized protein YegP (UPF0339 family)
MRYFRVVERNTETVIRHEGYRTRREAEGRAAERANLLSDNSPIEIGVEISRAR